MSNVPKLRFNGFQEEWSFKPLNAIATINPKTGELPESFIYIDLESVDKGNLIKQDTVKRELAPSRAQRVLKDDDILFQMVRPYQRNNYLFRLGKGYVASTGYAQIRAKESPDFLNQKLLTNRFVSDVLVRCTGTSYPAINSSDLAEIEIALPKEVEQQRIAAFLSAVDAKIEQLTKKEQLLQQYKKGVMHKLFSQEIRFKADDGSEFSEWENKVLGDLGSFTGGGTPSTSDHTLWQGDIPWISSSDIYESSVKPPIISRWITQEALESSATKLTSKGSILFVSRVGVGKLSIAPCDLCTSQDFTNLKLKSDSNSFVAYYFLANSHVLLRYSQGTSIKGFTTTELKKVPISMPCVEEQLKIADAVLAIDTKLDLVSQQLESAKTFKKGLLQQMFV